MDYAFAIFMHGASLRATLHNDKILASPPVYAIAVRSRRLSARCAGHIDPRHPSAGPSRSASEEAVSTTLPPIGATLASDHAGLDTVAAMAILRMRARGVDMFDPRMLDRVRSIAGAGSLIARGRASYDIEWNSHAAAQSDVPLIDRIDTIERWLRRGDFSWPLSRAS